MTADKQAVDWERIEAEYRAGILSLRQIALLHPGVSHVTIGSRAKKLGWKRDLKKRIEAKTAELLNKAALTPALNNPSTVSKATEDEVVDANAQVRADVVMRHRTTIKRGHGLVESLFAELEYQTEHPETYERLLEAVSEDMNVAGKNQLRQAFSRAMAVGNRISGTARLTEGLKNLVGLERQAWGLDEPEKPTEDLRNLSDAELMGQAIDLYAKDLAARGQD